MPTPRPTPARPSSNSWSSTTPLVEGGDVNVTVRVWAEETDSIRDYPILVHTVSTDSSLIDLTVSNHPAGLSTPFVSSQLDYVAFVDSQVASVSLFPVPTHPLATLSYSLQADQ